MATYPEITLIMRFLEMITGIGLFRTAPVGASGNRIAEDAHSRIHQGVMYHTGAIVASLADTASFNIGLTTPATGITHLVFGPGLDGSADSFIYEGAAFSAGTALSVSNHNRNSSNTYGGTVVHTPTITNDGTEIHAIHIPGGTGPHAAGGEGAGFGFERPLKASTKYVFRITNTSGQAQRGGISLHFYTV